MKCALAAVGFINENLQHNKKVIIETMVKCSKEADMVIFGESFMQGFYGLTFDVEHDEKLVLSQNDLIIKEICEGRVLIGGKIQRAEFLQSQGSDSD